MEPEEQEYYTDNEETEFGEIPNKKSRRFCVYNSEWEQEYPFIKPSPTDAYIARCNQCFSTITIKFSGVGAIKHHILKEKHIKSLKSSENSNAIQPKVSNFFYSKQSKEDQQISLAELVSTFHSVQHHHSYLSTECGNKLFPLIFNDSNTAKKISCARTKTEAIVVKVLAPFSIEIILTDLENCFYSLSIDASNKGNRKYFPIVLSYFKKTEGCTRKLFDFYEDSHESADAITSSILDVIRNSPIKLEKLVSYSADNANVNYGKTDGVFAKLKRLQKNILQANCNAHVLHNMARHGLKVFTEFDVESFVLKVYSEFSHSSKKRELFKELCEFATVEFREILRHVPTRWLSLEPAINRILLEFPALRLYFAKNSELKADIIKKFFGNGDMFTPQSFESFSGECVLYFTHNLIAEITKYVLILESEQITASEIFGVLERLKESLETRIETKFFGSNIRKIFKNLDNSTIEELQDKFVMCLQRCLNYLHKWFNFEKSPFRHFKIFNFDSTEIFTFNELLSINDEHFHIEVNEDNLIN